MGMGMAEFGIFRRSGIVVAAIVFSACGATPDLSDSAREDRIGEMYAEYEISFANVEAISVEEYVALLGTLAEPVLVDVRKPAERAVSMIPGAIAKEEFEQRRDELNGRNVVTYCTVGYRSGLYASELLDEGWAVLNLEGSILAWTHSGRDLVADGEPVRRLHVYGRQWDLAASGYEAVW